MTAHRSGVAFGLSESARVRGPRTAANPEAFVTAADSGTLPPEFPLECGSVYTGDVQKIVGEAINGILAGKTAASPALRDAAAQINRCIETHPTSR
jgi:hypothetical protein